MKANRLLIIALLASLFSFGKWEEINSSTTENLNCIQFFNSTGYAAGQNGELVKTTNGGLNWSSINSTTSANITAIHFRDESTGYYTSSDGKVFKTTNGGSSWTSKNVQNVGALNGIDFLNNQIGLAVGDNGFIHRTTDGGNNWTDLGNVSVFVVNDVAFINDTLAVAVGAQGSILSSSDAGLTWYWQGISSTNTFSAVEKLSASSAGIVGTDGVYLTFNASSMTASSETTIDASNDWLKDIHLAPSGKIYAVGFSQSILVTNPSWKTWDLDSVNNLNGISFMNDTIGFACGNNGKIYKTVTAGFPIGQAEISIQPIKLYPNPASNFIQFNLPINTSFNSLEVSVYNNTGQLIENKITPSESFNIEHLNSGLYFISIRNKATIYRGKFLKK